jgi:hypothetical protein
VKGYATTEQRAAREYGPCQIQRQLHCFYSLHQIPPVCDEQKVAIDIWLKRRRISSFSRITAQSPSARNFVNGVELEVDANSFRIYDLSLSKILNRPTLCLPNEKCTRWNNQSLLRLLYG